MLSRLAFRAVPLIQTAAFSTKSATENKLHLKVTRSDEVSNSRWDELEEVESRLEQHYKKTEFKGLRHCTSTGYRERLSQYREGRDSWVCEAYQEDRCVGYYAVSARDIWREGKPERMGYGYLARVPDAKNHGIGKYLMAQTVFHFERTHTMYHGLVARDNLPQMKVAIFSRPVITSDFQGEGALYLVDPSLVPKVDMPRSATVTRVDSEQQIESTWDRVYGKQGNRLRDHTAEFLQSPYHGGFWIASDGENAAGLSIWNPTFASVVDLDGSLHPRSIFYNLWSTGPLGNDLLLSLYSAKLQESRNRFVITSVWRHKPAPPEKHREHVFPEVPTFASHPLEHFISPNAVGINEELSLSRFTDTSRSLLLQPCLFWDPRDCSTLLSFQPPPEKIDF